MKNLREDARAHLGNFEYGACGQMGYVPLELPVMEDMLKKLKLIVDPTRSGWSNTKVSRSGSALAFRISKVLLKTNNGNCSRSLARLIFGVKKLRDYRSLPRGQSEWHKRALDALIHSPLRKPESKEIPYGGELHPRGQPAHQKRIRAPRHADNKTYRIYEKPFAR
jgi:hypothetical protein